KDRMTSGEIFPARSTLRMWTTLWPGARLRVALHSVVPLATWLESLLICNSTRSTPTLSAADPANETTGETTRAPLDGPEATVTEGGSDSGGMGGGGGGLGPEPAALTARKALIRP